MDEPGRRVEFYEVEVACSPREGEGAMGGEGEIPRPSFLVLVLVPNGLACLHRREETAVGLVGLPHNMPQTETAAQQITVIGPLRL